MAGYYSATRRHKAAAPLADFVTAAYTPTITTFGRGLEFSAKTIKPLPDPMIPAPVDRFIRARHCEGLQPPKQSRGDIYERSVCGSCIATAALPPRDEVKELFSRIWYDFSPLTLHTVPLVPDFSAVLESCPRFKGDYIFSTTAGRRPISGFSKAKLKLNMLMRADLEAQGKTCSSRS